MKKVLVSDLVGAVVNTGTEELTILDVQQIGGGLMIVDFSDKTATPPIPNNTYLCENQIISRVGNK